MNPYSKTHAEFSFSVEWNEWYKLIHVFRDTFGDTDMYAKLTDRPWFTSACTLYLRHDLCDDTIMTFFLLKTE